MWCVLLVDVGLMAGFNCWPLQRFCVSTWNPWSGIFHVTALLYLSSLVYAVKLWLQGQARLPHWQDKMILGPASVDGSSTISWSPFVHNVVFWFLTDLYYHHSWSLLVSGMAVGPQHCVYPYSPRYLSIRRSRGFTLNFFPIFLPLMVLC